MGITAKSIEAGGLNGVVFELFSGSWPRGLKMVQEGAKMVQDRAKTELRWSKIGPRQPKTVPKHPKTCSRQA